jgi:uncharacterized protein (TIGR02145 family)
VYNGVYSDLQVSCEDPHGLVDHIIQPVNKSNPAASGKEPFTVVFKSGVKTSVPVSGRDTVKLLISYNVGSDAKFTIRYIRVQDAACHCPARIDRLSDRWLTFACHNLGGLDILSSTTTITQAHHGDWYRWGAAVPSVQNLNTTTDADPAGWTFNHTGPAVPEYQDYTTHSTADWYAAKNPCPAGWRLPTNPEFAAAINRTADNGTVSPDNNSLDWPGTWSTSRSDKTNFSALLKVGDYLYLPAAGCRNGIDGSLLDRGYYGYYWSSSALSYNSWLAYFDRGDRSVGHDSRTYGFSVRCVAAE